jgi:outer membrane protein TolC
MFSRFPLFQSLFSVFIVLSVVLIPTWGNSHELIDYVHLSLQQSDTAHNLADMYTLSNMSVTAEKYQFDYHLIPLSNIGVAKGTGSQTLGMEVKQKLDFGTELTAGIRGDRTNQDYEYAIENRNSARAYIKVSQGIFRKWGKKYNLSSLNIAKLKNEERKLQNERQIQDLILRTASSYYQLVLAKQLIHKSEQALLRSREHLAAAKSRQSVGLVSKVDVYRAELASLNSENSFQDKKQSFKRARDLFNELLGLRQGESSLNVTDTISMISPIVPDSWEEALLKNRLDWQAYRLKAKYAQIALYKAQQNTKPDVHLNFNIEQKGQGESIGDAANLDETNWSFQLEMRSTLDLFNEKMDLARENIKIHRLRREGASLRRKILREAKDALEDLKTQERYYQINIKRMEQSGNALELTKIRYERGLSDNLDVLDAENAYSTAELDISRAMIAYNIAAIKLAYALGVLDVEWLQLSLADINSNRISVTKTAPALPPQHNNNGVTSK